MMMRFLIFSISMMLTSLSFSADEIVTIEKPNVVAVNAEEQIPLNIDIVKKAADAPPASARILLTGVIIASMLGAAYFFVRKYKTSNTINKSNMQIKVLSQHYLGPKKSLAIIHVAGESILVGITESNISMIKSLSLIDDEIPVTVPKNFSDAMTNSTKPAAKTDSVALEATFDENDLEEEFSFAGLKDSVSKKLKSMRSI